MKDSLPSPELFSSQAMVYDEEQTTSLFIGTSQVHKHTHTFCTYFVVGWERKDAVAVRTFEQVWCRGECFSLLNSIPTEG